MKFKVPLISEREFVVFGGIEYFDNED